MDFNIGVEHMNCQLVKFNLLFLLILPISILFEGCSVDDECTTCSEGWCEGEKVVRNECWNAEWATQCGEERMDCGEKGLECIEWNSSSGTQWSGCKVSNQPCPEGRTTMCFGDFAGWCDETDVPVIQYEIDDCSSELYENGYCEDVETIDGNGNVRFYAVCLASSFGTQLSEREAADKLEEIMTRSFDLRMVSDVPVGVFLSGGIDSSVVTALLQKERTEPVKTFTIGFESARYNEAAAAKAVAKHLGTDHHELYCDAHTALDIIPRMPDIYDEPFGDSSGIPRQIGTAE